MGGRQSKDGGKEPLRLTVQHTSGVALRPWGVGSCPVLVGKLSRADRRTGMVLKEAMTPTLDEGGVWRLE